MRGYLSCQWLLAQHSEFPKSLLSGLRITWFRTVILSIWKFHITMWSHRNLILHANSESSRAIRESPIDLQIQKLYSIQDTFAATDRVLFTIPLQTRLQTSLRSKKHWLTLVSKYRQTTKARRNDDQLLISKFFVRRKTPATESDTSQEPPNNAEIIVISSRPSSPPDESPRPLQLPAKPGWPVRQS